MSIRATPHNLSAAPGGASAVSLPHQRHHLIVGALSKCLIPHEADHPEKRPQLVPGWGRFAWGRQRVQAELS